MRSGRTLPAGVLAAAIALTSSVALGAPQADGGPPGQRLAGIDVSTHNGPINWTAVEDDTQGIRFAFVRASSARADPDGFNDDPRFLENMDGAAASGIAAYPYHTAHPDTDPNDAVLEADHFAARLAERPARAFAVALEDTPESEGMTPAQMVQWLRSFLARLDDSTGRRAIIYTSPAHWRERYGDTDEFARDRYALWLAHHTAGSADVPAQSWNARGWLFWQWNPSGSVRGIDGDVDLNRGRGWPYPDAFDDDDTNPHQPEIDTIADRDITGGCATRLYCPRDRVTRAEMASFLVRAIPLSSAATQDHFPDDNGSVHEENINRLFEADITGGCGRGRYCPSGTVTRDQMASFLARARAAKGEPLPDTTEDYFIDDETSIHEPNINRLAEAEITGGCGAGRYCPGSAVTRAQMATFLAKAFIA